MPTDNIPELYLDNNSATPDIFVYDLKMTEVNIKTKVNLNMHMFSFLQTGKKQVYFADTSVLVDNNQSLLIKKGNCLWTELLDTENIYYCKLLFFSELRLKAFIAKYLDIKRKPAIARSYFAIENDTYIRSYLHSLSTFADLGHTSKHNLLCVKFEELLVYLLTKYQTVFEDYLLTLVSHEASSFHKNIEQNTYSSLNLEEIAFLCNMSKSTFKRHFIKEFKAPPGKWFRDKRLLKAKEILEEGKQTSSDIYLDFGYNNLSNFSSAFKTKFGISPSDV